MTEQPFIPIDKEVEAFLEELKGSPPTPEEILECKQSLLSLGKAIVNFYSPIYE